jgi:MFS family permease
LVAFILGGNGWTVLVGVLLWAVGVSMGFPLGMSAAAESGPDPAARVSVVASVGYFGNVVGPPVIGALAASAGLLNALWLLVALFLAAFVVAGSLRRPGAPAPLAVIVHAGPGGSRQPARISARGACGPKVAVFPGDGMVVARG